MQEKENTFENFRKSLSEYLKSVYSLRKNSFTNKCLSASINEKSPQKKLAILVGQELFVDGERYNGETLLNDKELTESAAKLLSEALIDKLNPENFNEKFFKLSKVIHFFYEFSKIYSEIFHNLNIWPEIFVILLFKKKYEKNQVDLINSIGILASHNFKEKYEYDKLKEKIVNQYDINNNIISEYFKIFFEEINEYQDKIKLISKRNPNCNIEELHKILDEKKEKITDSNKNEIKFEKVDIITYEIIKEKNDNNNQNYKPSSEIHIDNINSSNNEKKVSNNDLNPNNLEIGNNIINSKANENLENKKNLVLDENKINNNKEEATNFTSLNELSLNLKTVKDYLEEKLHKYQQKRYDTPFLRYKLKKNKNFTANDISFLKDKTYEPDEKLNHRILKNLLEKMELNKNMPDPSQIGYFCYINKYHQYVEALYSVIAPELIYEDITKYNEPDDYNNSKDSIKKIYVKNRAKSFEYYINKTIFVKRYKKKQYPAIIFPLKSMKYNKYFKKYIIKDDYKGEIEIDGSFFIDNSFVLEEKEFPFENQQFGPSFQKTIFGFNNINNDDGFRFNKNDMCLIEIKTNLPFNSKINNSYNANEKDFEQVINDMLYKMVTFEQLFKDIDLNYERIRLILFYDLVKKYNYESELNGILKSFRIKNKYLDYMDKVFFRIIYIDSNFFAESLKTFGDKIDNLILIMIMNIYFNICLLFFI